MSTAREFRFLSFHERVKNISINPVYHVDFTNEIFGSLLHENPENYIDRNVYYTGNQLDSECKKTDDKIDLSSSAEDIKLHLYEKLKLTFFKATLNYWLQRVNTSEFVIFAKELTKYTESLPHIILHFPKIIKLLLDSISTWKNYTALEPVYHLLAILPKDVQKEFQSYLPNIFEVLIEALDTQHVDSLEYTFYTLAALFKSLSSLIIKDIRFYLRSYHPWLLHKSIHVRLFAAESLSFYCVKRILSTYLVLLERYYTFLRLKYMEAYIGIPNDMKNSDAMKDAESTSSSNIDGSDEEDNENGSKCSHIEILDNKSEILDEISESLLSVDSISEDPEKESPNKRLPRNKRRLLCDNDDSTILYTDNATPFYHHPADTLKLMKTPLKYTNVILCDKTLNLPFISAELCKPSELMLCQAIGSLLFETIKNINSTLNSKSELVLDILLSEFDSNDYTQGQCSMYFVIMQTCIMRIRAHVKTYNNAAVLHEKLTSFFLHHYQARLQSEKLIDFWFCQCLIELNLMWLFAPFKPKNFPVEYFNRFISNCFLKLSAEVPDEISLNNLIGSELIAFNDRFEILNLYILYTLCQNWSTGASYLSVIFKDLKNQFRSCPYLLIFAIEKSVYHCCSKITIEQWELDYIKQFTEIIVYKFLNNNTPTNLWSRLLEIINAVLPHILLSEEISTALSIKVYTYAKKLLKSSVESVNYESLNWFLKESIDFIRVFQDTQKRVFNWDLNNEILELRSSCTMLSERFCTDLLKQADSLYNGPNPLNNDIQVSLLTRMLKFSGRNEQFAQPCLYLWFNAMENAQFTNEWFNKPFENQWNFMFWAAQFFDAYIYCHNSGTFPFSNQQLLAIAKLFGFPKHDSKLKFLKRLQNDENLLNLFGTYTHVELKNSLIFTADTTIPFNKSLLQQVISLMIVIEETPSTLETEKIVIGTMGRLEQLMYKLQPCWLLILCIQQLFSACYDPFTPIREFSFKTLTDCITNSFGFFKSGVENTYQVFLYWIFEQAFEDCLRCSIQFSMEKHDQVSAQSHEDLDDVDTKNSIGEVTVENKGIKPIESEYLSTENIKKKKKVRGFVVKTKKTPKSKRYAGSILSKKFKSLQTFFNESVNVKDKIERPTFTDPVSRFRLLSKLLRYCLLYILKRYGKLTCKEFLNIKINHVFCFTLAHTLSLLSISPEELEIDDSLLSVVVKVTSQYAKKNFTFINESISWIIEIGPVILNDSYFKLYRDPLINLYFTSNVLLYPDRTLQINIIRALKNSSTYGEIINVYQEDLENFVTDTDSQMTWLSLTRDKINPLHSNIIDPIFLRLILSKLYKQGSRKNQKHLIQRKRLVTRFLCALPSEFAPILFSILFRNIVDVTMQIFVNEEKTEIDPICSQYRSENWLYEWFKYMVYYVQNLPPADWFWRYDYDNFVGRWVWGNHGQLIFTLKKLLKTKRYRDFALFIKWMQSLIELKHIMALVDVFLAQFLATVIALLDPDNNYETDVSRDRIKQLIRNCIQLFWQLIQNHFEAYELLEHPTYRQQETFEWKLGIYCSSLYTMQTTVHTLLKTSIQNGHLSSTLKFVCWFGRTFERLQLMENGLCVVFPIIWDMLSSPAVILNAKQNKPFGASFDYVMDFLNILLHVKVPENFTSHQLQKMMLAVALRSKNFRDKFKEVNHIESLPLENDKGNSYDSETSSVEYAKEYCYKYIKDLKFTEKPRNPECRRDVLYPYTIHITGPAILEPYVEHILLKLYNVISVKSTSNNMRWTIYVKYLPVIKSLVAIADVKADTTLILVIRLFLSILPSGNAYWVTPTESLAKRLYSVFDTVEHLLSRFSFVIARCKARAKNPHLYINLLDSARTSIKNYIQSLNDLTTRQKFSDLLMAIELSSLEILGYKTGVHKARVVDILASLKKETSSIKSDEAASYIDCETISSLNVFSSVPYIKKSETKNLWPLCIAYIIYCCCALRPRCVSIEPNVDLQSSVLVKISSKPFLKLMPSKFYHYLSMQMIFLIKHPDTDWSNIELAQSFLRTAIIDRLARVAQLRQRLAENAEDPSQELITKVTKEWVCCIDIYKEFSTSIIPEMIKLIQLKPKHYSSTAYLAGLQCIFYTAKQFQKVYDFLPCDKSNEENFTDWSIKLTEDKKLNLFSDLSKVVDNENESTDIFGCLLHIQKHQKVNGLTRLEGYLIDLSNNTIQNIITPILINNVTQLTTKAAFSVPLAEKALSLLIKLSQQFHWNVLKQQLNILQETLTTPTLAKVQETFIIRAICGMISSFYSNLSLSENQYRKYTEILMPILTKLSYRTEYVSNKDKYALEKERKQTIRPIIVATQVKLLSKLSIIEFQSGINKIVQKLVYFLCSKNRIIRKKIQSALTTTTESLDSKHFILFVNCLYDTIYARDTNPDLIAILFYTIKTMMQTIVFKDKSKGTIHTKPIKLKIPAELENLHSKLFDLIVQEVERLCDSKKITSNELKRFAEESTEATTNMVTEDNVVHEARTLVSSSVIMMLTRTASTKGISELISFIWKFLTGKILYNSKSAITKDLSVDRKYYNVVKILCTQIYNGVATNPFLSNEAKLKFLYRSFEFLQSLGINTKSKLSILNKSEADDFNFVFSISALSGSNSKIEKKSHRIQTLEIQPGAATGKHVLHDQKPIWDLNKEAVIDIICTVTLRFALLTVKDLKNITDCSSITFKKTTSAITEWLIVLFCKVSGHPFIWACRTLIAYLNICVNKFVQYRKEISMTLLTKFESSTVHSSNEIAILNHKTVKLSARLLLELLSTMNVKKNKTTAFQSLIRDANLAIRYKRSLLEQMRSNLNHSNTLSKPLLKLFKFMIITEDNESKVNDESYNRLVNDIASLIYVYTMKEYSQVTDKLSFAGSIYVDYVLTYPLSPKLLEDHLVVVSLSVRADSYHKRCIGLNMIFLIVQINDTIYVLLFNVMFHQQNLPKELFVKKYLYTFILPLVMQLGEEDHRFTFNRIQAVIKYILELLPDETTKKEVFDTIIRGFSGPKPVHYIAQVEFLYIYISFYGMEKLKSKLKDCIPPLQIALSIAISEHKADGSKVKINECAVMHSLISFFNTIVLKIHSSNEMLSTFFDLENSPFRLFQKLWLILILQCRVQSNVEALKLKAYSYEVIFNVLKNPNLQSKLFSTNRLAQYYMEQKQPKWVKTPIDWLSKEILNDLTNPNYESEAYILKDCVLECIVILIFQHYTSFTQDNEENTFCAILRSLSWNVRKGLQDISSNMCRVIAGMRIFYLIVRSAPTVLLEDKNFINLLLNVNLLGKLTDMTTTAKLSELVPAVVNNMTHTKKKQIISFYASKLLKLLKSRMLELELNEIFDEELRVVRMAILKKRSERRSRSRLLRVTNPSLSARRKLKKHKRSKISKNLKRD